MPQTIAHPERILIICLFLPVVAFFAFGLHGFCDTDQGFIQALSWRIVQGEVPYRDFIYVRPPVSIYLHALPMLIFPPEWVLLLGRFTFYLFMGLSVFWITLSLQSYFDFKEIGLSPEAFALISFICCVHNFPPMPWHTVDGIFFASLGLNRISRGKNNFQLFLGLVCMILAALSKQAFYPMIIAGLFLLGFLKGKKILLKISALTGLFLAGFAMFIMWADAGWFVHFWQQTTGATELKDLVEIGVVRYVKPFVLIVIPLLIVWRAQSLYDWKYLPAIIFGSVFLGLLGMHVYHTLKFHTYTGPSYGFSQTFFLLSVGVALKGLWINPRAFSLLLCLLMISWCTGISWGYANTMLCFTPILFGVIYGLYEEFNFTVPRYFYSIIVIILIWIFAILYQYPYREAPREQITHSLAEIFPRFGGIRSGEEFYAKTVELKLLNEKYGGRFSVLPAYPLANFLTETANPLSTDWAHNVEVNYFRNQERLEAELAEKADFIFIEKDKIKEARDSGPYGSLLTGFVLDHGEKIETGVYFDVYRTKHSIP
ncbi:MAG: hypothetical protein SF052_23640 [Bacteroidia bacterium]|nr:hypothetical protein [Bacteroidia bacterium]